MADQKDKFLNDIKKKKKKSKDKKKTQHNNTTQEQDTTQKHNTNKGKDNKYTITKKAKNNDNKKLRRNFYISTETDDYLNQVSKKTNRSKSELVETAIEIMKQEAHIE